jgi:hypothetical protein
MTGVHQADWFILRILEFFKEKNEIMPFFLSSIYQFQPYQNTYLYMAGQGSVQILHTVIRMLTKRSDLSGVLVAAAALFLFRADLKLVKSEAGNSSGHNQPPLSCSYFSLDFML